MSFGTYIVGIYTTGSLDSMHFCQNMESTCTTSVSFLKHGITQNGSKIPVFDAIFFLQNIFDYFYTYFLFCFNKDLMWKYFYHV